MNDLKEYLSTVIEEYKTLRDESKQASINMFSALQWGATVLGLVMGAGFTLWNKQHLIVLIIFYLVIPVLSGMSMFLWLGEAARFKRVGDYLCIVEQKVGLVIGRLQNLVNFKSEWVDLQRQLEKDLKMSSSEISLEDPLIWERWLRSMRKSITEGHLSTVYKFRFIFFPAIMLFSFFTATYYVLTHPRFLPSQLSYFKNWIPDIKLGVLILMAVSILISLAYLGYGFLIARRLNVKLNPTIRNNPRNQQ